MFGRSRKARVVATRKKLTAFLDEGSDIEGKYTFTGTVLLNGKFQGEIASPDTLIIGERGVVNATVRAGTLVVNGELVGNVHASERVELTGKARVFGDLESPIVVLDEGVMFEGHCRMPRTEASEPIREAAVVSLKRS
jgi:cytoskeletal protein CcmA (bactofilin family)